MTDIEAEATHFTLHCTTDEGVKVTIVVNYPEGQGMLAAAALVEAAEDEPLEGLLYALATVDDGVKSWLTEHGFVEES